MRKVTRVLEGAMSIGLSLAMAISFTVPTTALAQGAKQQENTGSVQLGAQDEDTSTQSDYTNQYFKELLQAGQLTCGDNTNITTSDDTNGVLVSGPRNELANQGITVSKTLDFNEGAVSRVRVQGLVAYKTSASIACYLDNGSDPIATMKLPRQKKTKSWDVGTKDCCVDLTDLKLTGKHTVSFKIVSATAEQPQVFLKCFEFMEFTVPTVNFNIDEELGSIEAMNTSEDHSAECYGSVDIVVPEGFKSEYTGEQAQGGSYELDYVRGRGNSTWSQDIAHKPYKVKFAEKQDILGMGANKHWVLIANYYDNSQLRNKISYWLSEQLGFDYTVKLEPVEVTMNGEYYGSYWLCEQVRVGKNRVAIDDLEDTPDATDEDTISGGYLLNMGYSEDPHQTITTGSQATFVIESPKFEDYFNETQYNYINDYVCKTEEAIYGDDFKDSDGNSYADYLDVDSAVDFLWMQEFSMNGDAYSGGSNYLYKKRNGKLYFGPVWDFDYVAWGSTEYNDPKTEGWSQVNSTWVSRLLKDDGFVQVFTASWQQLKTSLAEITREGGKLDQYAERISKAVNYNVEKYGMSKLNWAASSQEDDGAAGETGLTFEQEVERLRTWITDREGWVDSHLDQLTPIKCTVTVKNGSETLQQVNTYVGENLFFSVDTPVKENCEFVGWHVEYTVDCERFLLMMGWTEDDLLKQYGEEDAANIKANGYKVDAIISADDIEQEDFNNIRVPGDITVDAVFKEQDVDKTIPAPAATPSTKSSLMGTIVAKGGVLYQITGISASAGRTAKVVGLSKKTVKKAFIAKSLKINGKKYTVTEIGAKAFKACKKLKRIVIKGKGLYVRNATFKRLSKKLVIKVPRSSVGYYKNAIKSRKVKAA